MLSFRDHHSSLTFYLKPFFWIVFFSLFFIGIFLYAYQQWMQDFYRQVDIQHRQNLIQLVSLARNAIDPILQQFHSGNLSPDEARIQVCELVRHMIYEDQYGKNYIFMSSYDGIMLVQPFEPAMEMTNQWNLKDDRGFPIVQGLIQAAKNQPSGSFVQYNYHLPGVHKMQQKEAYVIGLPELNCYLGTGMYRQKSILEQRNILAKVRNGSIVLAIMVLLPVIILVMIILQRNRLLHKEIQTRFQAEKALQESETKYRTLFETMAQGVVYQNQKGEIISTNPAAERILGIHIDQILGKTSNDPDWKAIHEDGSEFKGDEHPAMIALQMGIEIRNEIMGVFNPEIANYVWINIHTTPQFKPDEEIPFQVYSTFEDITDRKRAENALRESERQIQTLLSNLPGMVYRCLNEPDRPIEFASNGSLDLTGYEPGELRIGGLIPYGHIIHPEDRWLVTHAIEDGIRHSRSFTIEYRIITKAGKEKWVWEQGQAVPSKIRNCLRLEGFITDITDRKQAEIKRLEMERQMLNAQKLESLGVLAGGIAHDFNNLLMTVMGNLSLAQMKLTPSSPINNFLKEALHAVHRAADLIRQILAYSGKGQFVISKINLNELIHEISNLIQTSMSKATRFTMLLSDWLPLIEADSAQIQQVVLNLTINASEAIGDKPGLITLITGVDTFNENDLKTSLLEEKPQPGQFVYLEVIDTGCGMDEQTIQRLFDPFFTTKFQGRGLGMSAVLGIVRSHHGAIHITSKPGEGTTVRILFPVLGAE